jgi:hypothetical protein
MKTLNDVEIRFESVKIVGKQISPTYGVMDILINAKLLSEFIKTGDMPQEEKAKNH